MTLPGDFSRHRLTTSRTAPLTLDDDMTPEALRHLSIPLVFAALLGGCALPVAQPGPMHRVAPAAYTSPPAETMTPERALALSRLIVGKQIVLLGEVHDNAAGHQLRTQTLQLAVQAGWRPAIAMEQFDRENQPLLDKAQATCADADCVIAMASPGKSAWSWELYKPVITLALYERLPLLAANLSRADASKVMREGLGSVFYSSELRDLNLDFGPPAQLLRAQEKEVEDGHCGMLPPAMHTGMATAQIARDAMMALVLSSVKDRPVVLLAGNGHVRRDLGVAQWLAKKPVFAVGFVEDTAPKGRYDHQEPIPEQARPDPCAAFKTQPPSAPAAVPPPLPAVPPPADAIREPFSRLLE